MAQKKSLRALAAQIDLFSDPERRAIRMTWDKVPESQRQRVLECLAQLIVESSDRRTGGQDGND